MKDKILIVVDMQYDFIDGVLGSTDAKNIVKPVSKKIKNFDGNTIIYTLDSHFEKFYERNYEGKRIPIHCLYREKGWYLDKDIQSALEYYESLKEEHQIDVVEKNIFGSVSELYSLIMHYGFCANVNCEEIEIVGLCTDICVVSNALILRTQFPDIKITVDASCCAGSSKENHEAALKILKANCIDVIGEK